MSNEQRRRERERRILREIVEIHIETGQAVGSKVVAERLGGRLSSASIRAVMNELDTRGVLSQPHTSAGRVPTDLGYRQYLEGLDPRRLQMPDRSELEALAWHASQTVLGLLKEAASFLSDRLGIAGLIAAPRLEHAVLQHIEFVWLRRGSVLAIVVTRAGLVHERLLAADPQLEREMCEALNNYLNSFLSGKTLAQVRQRIEEEQRRDRETLGELEARALDLAGRALADAEGAEVVVDGAASILELREFAEPGVAAELVRTLDRREVWLRLLDRVEDAHDTKIYLGGEVGAPLDECSFVAAGYGGPSGSGLVGVLGPKRLDYRRAIPLVGLVAGRLGALLDAAEADPDDPERDPTLH